MRHFLLIFLGSGLGGVCRYGLTKWLTGWFPVAFPVGTLAVNVLACLIIGLLMGLADDRLWLGQTGRLLLATGFCGGFSTFSTFSTETLLLLRTGQSGPALLYVGASLLLGLLATWLGLKISGG